MCLEQLTEPLKGTGLVYSSAELMGMKMVLMMEICWAQKTEMCLEQLTVTMKGMGLVCLSAE